MKALVLEDSRLRLRVVVSPQPQGNERLDQSSQSRNLQ